MKAERFRRGDEVTVVPNDNDDYILQFQRFTVVARVDYGADGKVRYWVTAGSSPMGELGPLEQSQLLPGWRDSSGAFRSW